MVVVEVVTVVDYGGGCDCGGLWWRLSLWWTMVEVVTVVDYGGGCHCGGLWWRL